MSEQNNKKFTEDIRMRDWKAEHIVEYAKLEKQKADAECLLNNDPKIVELIQKRILLDQDIAVLEELPRHSIRIAEQQQAGIKLELAEGWGVFADKTFECDAGTATLRITKSLHIRSKEKLVAFLELNKKLTDFIKGFEITKLRKIKDAGMLEDEIATWDEKKSVAIKIAETEQ